MNDPRYAHISNKEILLWHEFCLDCTGKNNFISMPEKELNKLFDVDQDILTDYYQESLDYLYDHDMNDCCCSEAATGL